MRTPHNTKQVNTVRTILDESVISEIHHYLDTKHHEGELTEEMYQNAKQKVIPNLTTWLTDKNIIRLSPSVQAGIKKAINDQRWEHLIYAFLDDVAFGTAGIRGLAALTEPELRELADKNKGLAAEILKGPNTINDIVLLIKSVGVANYAVNRNLKTIAIGYDSRIQGKAFATLIAQIFLERGLKVYLFDEASPFPELTFAVPFLKLDLGILISASHNDKRYNGYKITNSTGAQLSIDERNDIYNNFIKNVSTDEIKLIELQKATKNNLVFLGGDAPLDTMNYYGRELIDIHEKHLTHIKKFIDSTLLKRYASSVNVGYCAYHGSGKKAVPRLLKECGFTNMKIITSLLELNGLFPCFRLEQQPDPGDPLSAEIAVDEFKKEYGEDAFKKLDILIGTDPDADRCGLIIKIPPEKQQMYKGMLDVSSQVNASGSKRGSDFSWMLLDANTAWTLLLWYQIEKKKREHKGKLPCPEKEFIALSHTTTDALVSLAEKHGLGVVRTWVGVPLIANAVDRVWKGENITREWEEWKAKNPKKGHPVFYDIFDMERKPRSINVGTYEESNGYSIFGGPPLPGERLGENGHVKDKDGTFASILLAELAAYAKSQGTTIFDLIEEHIYLDPAVGLFVTYYEPAPYWGQFEGPTGISKKIGILKKAEALYETVCQGKPLSFSGQTVVCTEKYATGKYDELHCWKGFPDEGFRFFFDETGVNHLTIRPSGTSHCLRFHVQIKVEGVTRQNLLQKHVETHRVAHLIVADVRKMLGIET
jgi:phosphoglucomutase